MAVAPSSDETDTQNNAESCIWRWDRRNRWIMEKMHEEVHNLYSSPNIRVICLRMIKWLAQVACMTGTNGYTILFRKLHGCHTLYFCYVIHTHSKREKNISVIITYIWFPMILTLIINIFINLQFCLWDCPLKTFLYIAMLIKHSLALLNTLLYISNFSKLFVWYHILAH